MSVERGQRLSRTGRIIAKYGGGLAISVGVAVVGPHMFAAYDDLTSANQALLTDLPASDPLAPLPTTAQTHESDGYAAKARSDEHAAIMDTTLSSTAGALVVSLGMGTVVLGNYVQRRDAVPDTRPAAMPIAGAPPFPQQ